MKAQPAAARRVVLWVFVCSSIYGSGAETPAARPITGRPGVVLSRAVVNFSDLARQQASLPVQPQTQKIQPPEHDRPPRKPLPPGAIIKLAPEATVRPS